MRNSDEGAMMGTEENVKGQHASSVGTAALWKQQQRLFAKFTNKFHVAQQAMQAQHMQDLVTIISLKEAKSVPVGHSCYNVWENTSTSPCSKLTIYQACAAAPDANMLSTSPTYISLKQVKEFSFSLANRLSSQMQAFRAV
eukprot:1158306-Pelagomonas_calceolata.AAC.16